MGQIGNYPPSATAANYVPQNTINTAVQNVQPPVKFDVPAFESDSAASWLTWNQRVMYQARSCGFEAVLTTAEGERLSVGVDFLDRSKVDLRDIAKSTRRLDDAHQQLQRDDT